MGLSTVSVGGRWVIFIHVQAFGTSAVGSTQLYTPFEQLLVADLLPHPYFSLYLTRGSDITYKSEGLLRGSQICLGCVVTPSAGLSLGNQ